VLWISKKFLNTYTFLDGFKCILYAMIILWNIKNKNMIIVRPQHQCLAGHRKLSELKMDNLPIILTIFFKSCFF